MSLTVKRYYTPCIHINFHLAKLLIIHQILYHAAGGLYLRYFNVLTYIFSRQ